MKSGIFSKTTSVDDGISIEIIKTKGNKVLDRIKNNVVSESNNDGMMLATDNDKCFSLTKKQRLYGFGICFCLGYVISFMSTLTILGGGITKNAVKFGVLYSIGNVVSLSASGFLVGPCRQLKLMFKPIRRVAALVYVGLIFLILFIAILASRNEKAKGVGPLILLLTLIQCLAATWYSASYIPFGRKIIKRLLQRFCGSNE